MKRILHIPNYFLPHVGGIEDVCYNIIKILKEDDSFELRVICFNGENKTLYDSYEGIKVTRVCVQKQLFSQCISTQYYKELRKIIQEFDPEYIHFHAPNPFVALLLLKTIPANVKLIVHWHSDIVKQKFTYRLVKPIETSLLKRADMIIATSPSYIDYSSQLVKFRDKVSVIQNIIDPQKFDVNLIDDVKIKKIKAAYDNKPIVFFVGRHVPYKGLRHLIEAAEFIQNECHIIIAGNGPLTDKLKKQNTSKKVHFIGRISDEDLSIYYRATDIFAFPSITKNEAFGVVLAEALYCYVPAVTFTIKGSGVNWVNINNVTGLEVENSNSVEFAKAIDKLLSNEDIRLQFASNAHDRVMSLFIKDRIKDRVKDIYK